MASVAAQYSYLSSPLTMFVDPYTGRETARALFREIYGYWHTLPRDKRPKLYLHGLSLGAQNSEWSFEFFELMGDPIDGALWAGRPGPRGTGAPRPKPAIQARPRGVRSSATALSCGS